MSTVLQLGYFFRNSFALVSFFATALFSVCGIGSIYAGLEGIYDDIGSCIVINQDTGKVLFQKRAHEPLYPASCTKIATLAYILSLPNLNYDAKLTVPPEAVKIIKDAEKARENFSKYPSYLQEATGTSARLQAGEVITVRDALYGMMLVSGNDAANTLAYHFGNGSIEKSLQDINRFVAALGCKTSHFMNPHGLHHPEHISSAYDLALIALYGMRTLPQFKQIVSSTSYTKQKTNKQPAITWIQANKLLRPGRFYCEYATGIKTGRHMRAQENIVASGEKDGRSIIAVIMQCPDRHRLYQVAKKTLEHFLNEKKIQKTVFQEGPIKLTRSIPGGDLLPLYVSSGFKYEAYPSEEPDIKVVADWKPLRLPLKKGDVVGTLKVMVDGREGAAITIHAAQDRKMTIAAFIYQVSSYVKEDIIPFLSTFGWVFLPLLGYLFISLFKRHRIRPRRI